MPTAFTILLGITLLIIIVSWILGTTGSWKDADGELHNGGPAGIFDLFLAPMQGFKSKVDVIVFILVLGGFLGIVIESKALDAEIGCLVAKMKGREIWIIPIVMFLFSVGGTTYGMGEETIALYPVIIPVLLAAGFDVLTAVIAILFGAGIGCIGSTLNPFVIQVAACWCAWFNINNRNYLKSRVMIIINSRWNFICCLICVMCSSYTREITIIW
ncbi:MAG: hypothetical protein SPLM_02680 [Spiroplasma phoeniceum]|uniref:hypothetical protein n=1 Tax=Spiroplasma phoeniceum TaxID=47835 RepID=UPI00327ECB49